LRLIGRQDREGIPFAGFPLCPSGQAAQSRNSRTNPVQPFCLSRAAADVRGPPLASLRTNHCNRSWRTRLECRLGVCLHGHDRRHRVRRSTVAGSARPLSERFGEPVWILVGAGDIAARDSNGDEATAALLDNIGGTVFTRSLAEPARQRDSHDREFYASLSESATFLTQLHTTRPVALEQLRPQGCLPTPSMMRTEELRGSPGRRKSISYAQMHEPPTLRTRPDHRGLMNWREPGSAWFGSHLAAWPDPALFVPCRAALRPAPWPGASRLRPVAS
jgi:hypothetical protein